MSTEDSSELFYIGYQKNEKIIRCLWRGLRSNLAYQK